MSDSLPDGIKSWVESQTEGGSYSNASDYVRDLIRDQARQKSVADLKVLIGEGLASGISPRTINEMLSDAREQAGRHGQVDG